MILGHLIGVPPDVIGSALVGMLVAVVGWRLDRRTARIEILANGRVDDLLRRTSQLETALLHHGVVVPVDPAHLPLIPSPKE